MAKVTASLKLRNSDQDALFEYVLQYSLRVKSDNSELPENVGRHEVMIEPYKVGDRGKIFV